MDLLSSTSDERKSRTVGMFWKIAFKKKDQVWHGMVKPGCSEQVLRNNDRRCSGFSFMHWLQFSYVFLCVQQRFICWKLLSNSGDFRQERWLGSGALAWEGIGAGQDDWLNSHKNGVWSLVSSLTDFARSSSHPWLHAGPPLWSFPSCCCCGHQTDPHQGQTSIHPDLWTSKLWTK